MAVDTCASQQHGSVGWAAYVAAPLSHEDLLCQQQQVEERWQCAPGVRAVLPGGGITGVTGPCHAEDPDQEQRIPEGRFPCNIDLQSSFLVLAYSKVSSLVQHVVSNIISTALQYIVSNILCCSVLRQLQ